MQKYIRRVHARSGDLADCQVIEKISGGPPLDDRTNVPEKPPEPLSLCIDSKHTIPTGLMIVWLIVHDDKYPGWCAFLVSRSATSLGCFLSGKLRWSRPHHLSRNDTLPMTYTRYRLSNFVSCKAPVGRGCHACIRLRWDSNALQVQCTPNIL